MLFLSSVATFLAYAAIFALFHRFDWGQPVVKLACFEALFILILLGSVRLADADARPSDRGLTVELVVASAILGWELVRTYGLFKTGFLTGMNDLGQTTEEAVRSVFVLHENPYLRDIAKIGDDPAFFGFKYGPGMILGYGLSWVWPGGIGLKISNLVYLVVTTVLVAWLATTEDLFRSRHRILRWTPAVVGASMVLLPERLFHEIFNQGAVDMFPVMLLVATVACVRRHRWLIAGCMLGLSFSAKFSPAVFLLVLFFRQRISRRFLVGLALGLLPFVPFLLWNAPALVRNVFLFHSKKSFDTTSLYSVTPAELHYLFSLFQLCAVTIAVAIHFKRSPEVRSLITTFAMLLIAIEVSYREIHGNHLIWFVPIAALSLSWNRHQLARWLPCKFWP
jgi:hypothetical protein